MKRKVLDDVEQRVLVSALIGMVAELPEEDRVEAATMVGQIVVKLGLRQVLLELTGQVGSAPDSSQGPK